MVVERAEGGQVQRAELCQMGAGAASSCGDKTGLLKPVGVVRSEESSNAVVLTKSWKLVDCIALHRYQAYCKARWKNC